MGGAGVGEVCTLTEITISLLQWEKVARFTATDEVLLQYIAKITLSRYVRTQTRAKISTARFAIARHGTAVNPSRRLSVSNL